MKIVTPLLLLLGTLGLDAKAQTVHIASGDLVGQAQAATEVFLGVPYAAPPVGPLRWRSPQPVATWAGVRPASTIGPDCIQDKISNPLPATHVNVQSEDCLYLNVWRPRAGASAPFPVMVWIHGGAFIMGSGSLSDYDGRTLAAQGVIVVTLNYRLGRFGTFALPALSHEQAYEPHANYGVLDQIAALRWVQNNIGAFGGDPGNVTIFGESAGASSVNFLLTSPLAKGLFSKAISQSGGASANLKPLAVAEVDHAQWAMSKGISADDLHALRALPVDVVLDAPVRGAAFPVIDGRIILASTDEAFAAGLAAPVPYLVGANDYEQSLLRWMPGATKAMMDDLGDRAEPLLDLYQQPGEDRATALGRMWGEMAMVEPARRRAKAVANAGAPVWLYRYGYVPTALRGRRLGAGHADEIEMVFHNPSVEALPGWSEEDEAMARLVSGYWAAFAKTGAPAALNGPSWPEFSADHDWLMEFSNDGAALVEDFGHVRLDAVETATSLP